MRQNLIEGKVHRNIQQTQKKIFIFANELQFYISNHNIVNQVISFLIFFQYILYNLLSSLPIAQADSNSIQIIDYFYLIFCGTLSNPYKENVVDELLRYEDAYGFGFYVAAWIAPRLREFIACAGTMCIPWGIRTLEEYHESCVVWIGMLQEMQFAMDTVAGLNKGELDKQVAEGICTKEEIRKKVKKGCLLIDSAADAGNAIEGTHYTSIADPMYEEDGLFFYEVNNAPSLLYRVTSYEISKSFSEWVYKKNVKRFLDLL